MCCLPRFDYIIYLGLRTICLPRFDNIGDICCMPWVKNMAFYLGSIICCLSKFDEMVFT